MDRGTGRVLEGFPVSLEFEEVHALIDLIEQEGVANPALESSYEKLCRLRDRLAEQTVKRLIK